MITLEEPQKRNLTEEESFQLKLKFIDLLYVLLAIYLTLHQFLIPLVGNLFRGDVFYYDISWSFLVHFYGIYRLKKKKYLDYSFYVFLIALTLLQVVEGTITSGKWGLFSLILTQVTTIIFLYFVYPFVKQEKKPLAVLVAFIVGLAFGAGFAQIRVQSPEKVRTSHRNIQMHEEDFQVTLPGNYPLASEVSVWRLGNKTLRFAQEMSIKNDSANVIDIRLYELKIDEYRVKWRYKRLSQLRAGESWNLPLTDDSIYLVKSPERKDLQSLILIPQNYQFPLGEGILSVGFNSILWKGATHGEQ